MRVIIPCAGRSSRYPWTRPKFLLTMPDGRLMFEWAADKYIGKCNVTFVIMHEHAVEFDAWTAIKNVYGDRSDVDICVLTTPTAGPAETVFRAIDNNIDEAIIVQDCDSFFDFDFFNNQNFVCYIDLAKYPEVDHVAAKSFVLINEDEDSLRNIVEKSVISNNVCVGAYGFRSSLDFHRAFINLRNSNNGGEIFISHIVKHLLVNDQIFVTKEATNYLDLGTYDCYVKVRNNFSTYFVDLDGVVFYNQSRRFKNNYETAPTLIDSAVSYFIKKQDAGAKFIFTTSRPNQYSAVTEQALSAAGFKNFTVIYDLPHSPRVLVNDVSKTNPFPSATAINSPRDSDDFWRSMS